ncbi:NtaA/DmoA family FMN-dependent monooxygenase [Nesterenkonia salmonea]|uniref:NtaA/DmoA family FMN-dependent monooxygenase n=1 Tax=Nesterenkonia salmonea TaxID=1804987 RepID=A0A5R9BK14_9MICC|nr:NtaA/DmoA family FMN-dependent monooxygenase [Nesterenkonia salmonea]TLQ01046.1 NtaA/DmoA family FMN-dependent monooxygenase [Nesterenkonia salmonea]
MFKLGWFVDGYRPQTWRGSWAGDHRKEWMGPSFWVDIARSLERGGFDMLFMEDTSMIDDTYNGTMEAPLKYGLEAPKNDPMPLMPLLAQATNHIGVVSTISTLQYHPYLAARLGTTLDHLTEGRIGFNVVTSVSHRVAQNFGMEKMLDHEERYAMAHEWMDACTALWNSWEDGALLLDMEEPRFADHTKVHPVNFDGQHYKTRGPLNNPPGPQRRPVITQAGSSPAGRELAAEHADSMLSIAKSPEQMAELRTDMNKRLKSYGRNPEDFHIFFMCKPILGFDDREAQGRKEAAEAAKHSKAWIDTQLWMLSYFSGGEIDYGKYDLDAPFPKELGNGQVSTMKHVAEGAEEKTLREVITEKGQMQGLEFVGSPDTVADKMNDAIESTDGPDGFLIYGTEDELTRKNLAEVTDGLCGSLKKKGYIRDTYKKGTFRENLNDWG